MQNSNTKQGFTRPAVKHFALENSLKRPTILFSGHFKRWKSKFSGMLDIENSSNEISGVYRFWAGEGLNFKFAFNVDRSGTYKQRGC